MKRTVLIVILSVLAGFPGVVWSQDPAPERDFTFRRVKVPSSTAGHRITVQIDPEEQRFHLTPPRPNEASEPQDVPKPELPEVSQTPVPEDLPFAWYWAEISPKLVDGSSDRLEPAVNKLTNGPDGQTVPTPRLQTMQDIAGVHGIDILTATIGTKVSPALVLAVIGIESNGKATAVSSAGARGLMQLIPATAERFGVTDSNDPAENIKGGVAYLDWLMKKFGNDPVLVLAAYNAGENAVLRHEGVPPYAETRAYVPKVLAAWTVAKGLCLTPPQLISDGCVFAVREAKNDR
ncbi:MAG: lytic transglycosylase domain-containing protein [Paracoccaceae bacterium]